MNFFSTKLSLIRENWQSQAAAALFQGTLNECEWHLNKLHPKELGVYQNYQFERRRHSYLLGRLSCKEAVMCLTDMNSPKSIWIDAGVFQFPIIKGANLQNIQVSISHCGDIGLSLAFSEAHPMGIDVEKINPEKVEIILTQITESEKRLIKVAMQDRAEGYTRIFSIKEALSKVLKTGMMLDFKFLEIEDINFETGVWEFYFRHFGQYKALSFIKGNYTISIALPKKTTLNVGHLLMLIDGIILK